ncbi:molecular chaperone HtpG [Nevskia sp.]|uniref:molecular chaperone HtpG n=1 Tax=Nevskia sp. TaxID=1929292 RepID=UPI0025D23713|nr:molecular chaperone HtpG [Nevskia sp.]
MTTDTAAPPPQAQQHEFQTETRQLLKLMIHSLYSNKEIFLRELVSNASDAADKLRFLSIQNPVLLDGDADLGVDLVVDTAAGTLTIRDNGVGMSRQDLVDNLGTIARSGTKAFMEQLSADGKKDAQLIGQFGVGFYSAFIVADRVTVTSRKAGETEAHVWESTGEGSYSLEPAEKATRGTYITLHLREDEKEFLESGRLSHLVRKYSDHIGLPVRLKVDEAEVETLNKAAALWTRPKSELTDDDYTGFYTHLSHDPGRPLTWAHQRVEGNLSYISLLYIPSTAPFDLWDRDKARGLQLYVKRVFIMDHGAELLPSYLRFVKGLVDSDDLPLNVSRELLQGNRNVEKLKSALAKRVLDLLDDMAKNKPDDYAKFYEIFGAVLKEGLVEDQANRERIAKLCRFDSTASVDGAKVSLADYVARMPEGQTKIYYVTADSLAAARAVPHVEGFRKKGWEVLLLSDRIDEWVVMHLNEFDGKRLESCAAGGADLESDIATPEKEKVETEFAPLLERIGKSLGSKIESAKLSSRLVESPACLVIGDFGFSRRLEKILKQAGQAAPAMPPVLEINPEHPLVERLKTAGDAEFDDLAAHLYDQSVLAEGGQLDDPAAFVRRLNALILSGSRPAAEASRIIVD